MKGNRREISAGGYSGGTIIVLEGSTVYSEIGKGVSESAVVQQGWLV